MCSRMWLRLSKTVTNALLQPEAGSVPEEIFNTHRHSNNKAISNKYEIDTTANISTGKLETNCKRSVWKEGEVKNTHRLQKRLGTQLQVQQYTIEPKLEPF